MIISNTFHGLLWEWKVRELNSFFWIYLWDKIYIDMLNFWRTGASWRTHVETKCTKSSTFIQNNTVKTRCLISTSFALCMFKSHKYMRPRQVLLYLRHTCLYGFWYCMIKILAKSAVAPSRRWNHLNSALILDDDDDDDDKPPVTILYSSGLQWIQSLTKEYWVWVMKTPLMGMHTQSNLGAI